MKFTAFLITLLAAITAAPAATPSTQRPSALPPRPTPPGPAAAAPTNWQAGLRAKLLDGVKSVPKNGVPGPVAIFGQFAFPVIASNADGKSELALAAAAGYGKGRALIFGHNAYISAPSDEDSGKLLVNAVRWCGNSDKPTVLVAGSTADTFLSGKGFKVTKVKTFDAKDLKKADVLVLNGNSITEDEGDLITDYIKNGGGFICGCTGWAWEQITGGKSINDDHPGNRALRAVGLGWTTMTFPDQVKTFEAKTDLPAMMNAAEAVTALRKQGSGGSADLDQGINSLQIALSMQPSGRSGLQEAVLSALGNSEPVVPTAAKPLTNANVGARIRLGIETRVLKMTQGGDIKAHAASGEFPGDVPSKAARISEKATVDPTVPAWHSTGLYAAPGERISIAVPAEAVGKGFSVRIGCHTDTLYHLDKWLRAPDISHVSGLKEASNTVSSAFGGLIYIVVPNKTELTSPLSFTISGAVKAPHFILGSTTDDQWKNEISKFPAPWAEFECDKLVLSCPSDVARTVKNPTQLMEFWKKVVEDQDELSNQAKERKRPERIVADVQISAGYMHSGYPIMVPTSAAPEMVTFGRLKFPGWGFYHELGHNHQRGDFTFEGTGEVTNNVLALHVYEGVLGKDKTIGHSGASADGQKKHVEQIKKAGDKFAVWKKEPFLALTTYIQLVDEFGWDAWKKYLYSFSDPSFGPEPKSDIDKRDQFLVRYSKITNKNLAPFFEAWGIPTSSAAKAAVGKMETWMPKGMK